MEFISKMQENNIIIKPENEDLIIYVVKEILNILNNKIVEKISERKNKIEIDKLVLNKTEEYEYERTELKNELKYIKNELKNLNNDYEQQNKKLLSIEEKNTKDLEGKIYHEKELHKKELEEKINYEKATINYEREKVKKLELKQELLREEYEGKIKYERVQIESKQCTMLGDLHNKFESKKSSDRGDIGEINIKCICDKPLSCVTHGSEKNKCGDAYIFNHEIPHIKIMVESKNYGKNTSMKGKEIDKFKRDLDQDNNCLLGIFICWEKVINYEGIEHGAVHKYNDKYALYLSGEKANPTNIELKILVNMFYKLAEILYDNKHKNINNVENKWKECVNKIKDKITIIENINNKFKKQIDTLEKTTNNLRKTYNDNCDFSKDISEIIIACYKNSDDLESTPDTPDTPDTSDTSDTSDDSEDTDYQCDNCEKYSGSYKEVVIHEKICKKNFIIK